MASSVRLFGRSVELAAMGEAVARARDGSAVCVVLDGEAGIGKTSLVTATVEDHREAGDLVVFGHGVELAGGELPYGTGAEIIRHLARSAGEDALRAAAGQYASDLSALYPALGEPDSRAQNSPRVGSTPARLLPAFVSTVEALAGDRLVWLLIEDLQWVDESTRDLVHYLARVVDRCHLLLVITVRTDDRGTDPSAAAMAAALSAAPGATRILVSPLPPVDATALVASLTEGRSRQNEIARLVALGQGNPMLTEQLVAAGPAATEVPASLLAPMTARLRGLDPATRHLLHVACLGEGHLAHRLLHQVYERTADQIGHHGPRAVAVSRADFETAVDEAVTQRLLTFDPVERSYTFTHALLRHAVDTGVTPVDRLRLHRVWAQVLTAPGNHGDDPYLQIAAAHHWYDSDSDNEAFDAALTAAEYATGLQASAEKAVVLHRALTLWDRVSEPDRRYPAGRDELLIDVITAYDDCDQLDTALDVLDAELTRTGSEGDRLRKCCLRAARSAYAEWLGEGSDPDIASDLLDQREALSVAPPSSLSCWGHRALGSELWPSNPEASLQACRDAVEIALRLPNPRQLQGALSELQFHLVNAGHFDEALAAIEPALERAHSTGPPRCAQPDRPACRDPLSRRSVQRIV